MLTRLLRISLWTLTFLLLLSAIFVTALRVALPHLDRYQSEITQWINTQTQTNSSFEFVNGYWRNTHPSISLNGLVVHHIDGRHVNLNANKVDIEFDLLRSIVRGQLVIADLTISQLEIDASSIQLASTHTSSDDLNQEQANTLVDTLDRIFLRQLDYFSIVDSTIKYQSITGEMHVLAIEKLKWQNLADRHRAEGRVSIVGTGVNSLHVDAEFSDNGSFRDLSGQFYLQANQIELGPWLSNYLKKDMGIRDGEISFDAWIDLSHNKLSSTYIDFRPSAIQWGEAHEVTLQNGIIESTVIERDGQRSWLVSSHSFSLATDGKAWPGLDVKGIWSSLGWKAELAKATVTSVVPFIDIIPQAEKLKQWILALNPAGTIHQLRFAHSPDQPVRYSAQLENISTHHWALLPEVHRLRATVSGDANHAIIQATLKDDELPYGDVFQAPLSIENGETTFVWQKDDTGWRIWSNRVAVKTPHLSAIGEFRLDFPNEQSPLLAIYAEANLSDAGQAWRYLPTRALGVPLTDYLSTALQGGQANNAQILWYGQLKHFPYVDHTGVFQAEVSLVNGKYSFDTHWPAIEDLQLDLLFENESLRFESYAAKLMDVEATHIVGDIPRLMPDGHLDIDAVANGDGIAIRDYMMSSPLVDSVGAALTSVEVNGNVDASFKLHIPFDFTQQDVRAWGVAKLSNNEIELQSPPMEIKQVSGDIVFDNDVVTGKALSGILLGQRISLGFNGKSNSKGYQVHVASKGVWDVSKLGPYVGRYWTEPLLGNGPWSMDVDVQLNDVAFDYQIDLKGDLTRVRSRYPYPLNKHVGDRGVFSLQASGNQQVIFARAQLPNAKYQAEIDITQSPPVLTATNLVIGNGSFKPSPIVGHQLAIRTDKYNLDDWISLIASQSEEPEKQKKRRVTSSFPLIPEPTSVQIEVKELTAGTVEWHDAKWVARKQNLGWWMGINSQEAEGEASYIEPYDLSVSLKRLHIYSAALDLHQLDQTVVSVSGSKDPLITSFDRRFHEAIPNVTLHVADFWLQGYKVGKLNIDLQRQGSALVWKHIDATSGTNEIHASGQWVLEGDHSFTSLNLHLSGDNNSDLMQRFGVTSGIQKAAFSISSELRWRGAPWSMQMDTLAGKLATKLGKGVVSEVSGAARLIGLFSLDSIIRKMQLDFSDVFDSGLAFNSIEGSGEITNGIFVTNDIRMDAVAGDMTIKGLVDLNQRIIDSEVKFVPDITSGIPVLSAFAVTPVTALYVFAITKVISPVVEVFTEVNYAVTGPMDSPKVQEISRTKGEFTLPENLRNQVESQGVKQ
jgi:uncharacterized protein (TIGR02099 family)